MIELDDPCWDCIEWMCDPMGCEGCVVMLLNGGDA